jgi:glycerol uptake facilitator
MTGYAINPARDFGPRLASMFLGWGPGVFVSHDFYFWIPIFGPFAGGIAGVWLYDLAIGRYLPAATEPTPPGQLSEGAEALTENEPAPRAEGHASPSQ